MMNSKIGRRMLNALGAAVVTLSVGASGFMPHAVQAASTVPDTQNITLVKYRSGGDVKEVNPTTQPDPDMQRVNGAQYNVYDVTAQYWDLLKRDDITTANIGDVAGNGSYYAKNFDVSNLNPVKTVATKDGQANFDLPTKSSDGRGAVYLFREKYTPAGYAPAFDFLLGLPFQDDNGTYPQKLYVYPKDAVRENYYLKFRKVDRYNKSTLLSDAQFYLRRVTSSGVLYAKVQGQDTVTGFNADAQEISWVTQKADATKFVSDANGEFGLAGFPESQSGDVIMGLSRHQKYELVEEVAPKGYTTDFTLMDGAITVGTKATDAETDLPATVVGDKPENVLPHTGGKGIALMLLAGAAMIIIGIYAYRRRAARA